MSERTLNFQKVGDFQLEANSVEEACETILERLAILFAMQQPGESIAEFIEIMQMPSTDGDLGTKRITLSYDSPVSKFTIPKFFTYFSQVAEFCDRATKADEAGNLNLAWCQVSNAMYCMGLIDGLWYIEPANEQIIKAVGAGGAKSRYKTLDNARDLARELAMKKPYADRAKAARAIKVEVMAQAVKDGTSLTETRAERTIYEWLKGLKFEKNS